MPGLAGGVDAVLYAEHGGVRLWFEERGEGEPIVLIPGLGLTAAAWAEVGAELESGHRLCIAEPRGSGRSDGPDEPYSGTVLADDLAAVLDAAEMDSSHVVGMSMGGMIAQEFGLRHPGRARSLTLVSTYAAADGWSRRVFEVRRTVLERIGLVEHFRMALLFIYSPWTFEGMQERILDTERSLAESPPDRTAYLRQLEFILGFDARDRLGRIRSPALVVSGEWDLLTPAYHGREIAERIPGARFVQVPEASHALIWEQPATVAELVAGFVDLHAAG